MPQGRFFAQAYRLAKRPREFPLRSSEDQVSLLPMDQATRLSTVFALTGASLEAHLTELRRDAFTKAGATPIGELLHLKHGQRVKIGGVPALQAIAVNGSTAAISQPLDLGLLTRLLYFSAGITKQLRYKADRCHLAVPRGGVHRCPLSHRSLSGLW
jgi:hypothetical protein